MYDWLLNRFKKVWGIYSDWHVFENICFELFEWMKWLLILEKETNICLFWFWFWECVFWLIWVKWGSQHVLMNKIPLRWLKAPILLFSEINDTSYESQAVASNSPDLNAFDFKNCSKVKNWILVEMKKLRFFVFLVLAFIWCIVYFCTYMG